MTDVVVTSGTTGPIKVKGSQNATERPWLIAPNLTDEQAIQDRMVASKGSRNRCWYVHELGAPPHAAVVHQQTSPIARKVIIWEWLGDMWCGPLWVDYFRVFPYHPSGDGRPFPDLPLTPDEEEDERHRKAVEALRPKVSE